MQRVIAVVGALCLVGALCAGQCLAQPEPEAPATPGTFEAEGTEFVVQGESRTLTVTVLDPVRVSVHDRSGLISLAIEGLDGTTTTDVTIGGLEPGVTLYVYEDGLDDPSVVDVDAGGSIGFPVDVSTHHLILIQDHPSTIYLTDAGWSPSTVGAWDSSTKTATLTQDVNETVYVIGTNLTLDGGGFKISNGYVYVRGNGFTVEGLTVVNPSFGSAMYVYSASGVSVLNCDLTAYYGVQAYFADDMTIRGNTIGNASGGYGTYLYQTSADIESNTFSYPPNSAWVVYMYQSTGSRVVDNVATGGGPYCYLSNQVHVEGNSFDETAYGLGIWYYGSDNTIVDNDVQSLYYSLYRYGGFGLEVHGNRCQASGGYPYHRPVAMYYSGGNTFYNNDFVWDGTYPPLVVSGNTNAFNLAAPTGGNYWSAWTSPDADGDGFVDNPYVFGNGQDNLPYTTESGWDRVTVSGTVSASCIGPMSGVVVDLTDAERNYHTTVTGADGSYVLENVSRSTEGEIAIVVPLGFSAVNPPNGHTTISLTANQVVDFELSCHMASGEARSMGYWKHQARVYNHGHGNAQESYDDMATNFPAALFEHFHDNTLAPIRVLGVTHEEVGGVPAPITLLTIESTLSISGGGTMLDRAKQHYLALLLNVASGKLQTFTEISEDSKTVSQALQYVSALISDGDPADDELAKDVAETLNDAVLLATGVIPDDYETIYYSRTRGPELSLALWPNPGGPRGYTLSFGMPVTGPAELTIYNVAGRRIDTVVSGIVEAGRRQIVWAGRTHDGRPLGHGVYFARLTTAEGTKSTKFVHLAQ